MLIIFPVMFVYDGVPEVTPQYKRGNGKPTRPRRRKVLFVLEVSQCLVLGVSSWCWEWVGVGSELIFGVGSEWLTVVWLRSVAFKCLRNLRLPM